MNFRLFNIIFLVLLAGCARQTKMNVPAVPVDAVWEQHQQQAQALDAWSIHARVGVKTEEDSGSATLAWERSPLEFEVYLSGPLGQSLARLYGRFGEVTLEAPGRDPVIAASAEELLLRQTGWLIPFTALEYWVRALPAPYLDYGLSFSEQGLPSHLEQNGWSVEYSRYTLQKGISLPGRIRAEREGVRVTLIIREWSFDTAK